MYLINPLVRECDHVAFEELEKDVNDTIGRQSVVAYGGCSSSFDAKPVNG
jgi:hypothetical protein